MQIRVLLLAGLLCCAPAFAANSTPAPQSPTAQIGLEADQIQYNGEGKPMSASGNVKVDYGHYTLHADTAHFDPKTKKIVFENKCRIVRGTHVIHATRLETSLLNSELEAQDIHWVSDRLILRGKRVHFRDELITLEDASYTVCNLDTPHYLVKSKTIKIYPNWGAFLAEGDKLYVGGTPILYFPSYFYSAASMLTISDKKQPQGLQNSPVPEMGSSQLEGFFIKNHYSYMAAKESFGSATLGYTNKQGWLLGAAHHVLFTPAHQLNLSGAYLTQIGAQTKAEYIFTLFKNEAAPSQNEDMFSGLFKGLFNQVKAPQAQLQLKWSFQEAINNSLVNMSPLVQLSTDKLALPMWNLKLNAEIGTARIFENYPLENTLVGSRKYSVDYSVLRQWQPTPKMSTEISAEHSLARYSYTNWERLFFRIKSQWNFDRWIPEFSYRKKLSVTGASPFNFDTVNVPIADEIGMGFLAKFDPLRLDARLDYSVDAKMPRRLDFTAAWIIHCWQASITWEVKQRSIRFGVGTR